MSPTTVIFSSNFRPSKLILAVYSPGTTFGLISLELNPSSILFSKVYPIKQIAHNHEGNFISFILWGNYVEEVDGVDTNKKWINILNYKKFHKIKASKPVYTLMFMGKRINSETSAIVNGRIIPSSKIVRGYR